MSKDFQDWTLYSLKRRLLFFLSCKQQMDHNRTLKQHKGEQIDNDLQDQNPPECIACTSLISANKD